MDDPLVIADRRFTSRLILGTGGARSMQALERALQRLEEDLSGVERVVLDTSRLGRVDFSALMLLYDAEQRLSDQGLDVSITGLHGRGEMIMGRIRRG